MKWGFDEKPILILVKTYDIPYNEYFVDPVISKDYLKCELQELNENQSNTGALWDSYIPLSVILKKIDNISKVLKLDNPYTDAFKYFNKGINSFETCIRKQLVDYRKGEFYD